MAQDIKEKYINPYTDWVTGGQGTGTCSNLKKIVIWLAYQKNVVYLHRIC